MITFNEYVEYKGLRAFPHSNRSVAGLVVRELGVSDTVISSQESLEYLIYSQTKNLIFANMSGEIWNEYRKEAALIEWEAKITALEAEKQ